MCLSRILFDVDHLHLSNALVDTLLFIFFFNSLCFCSAVSVLSWRRYALHIPSYKDISTPYSQNKVDVIPHLTSVKYQNTLFPYTLHKVLLWKTHKFRLILIGVRLAKVFTFCFKRDILARYFAEWPYMTILSRQAAGALKVYFGTDGFAIAVASILVASLTCCSHDNFRMVFYKIIRIWGEIKRLMTT